MDESPKFNRSAITGIDENGKPVKWNIARFQRNLDIFRSPRSTQPEALKRLQPQLERIERFFIEGKVEELLQIMSESSPVSWKYYHESLGDAQLINDWSGVALSCLVGEDDIRPLRFKYLSPFGQNSAAIDADRYVALTGHYGKEAHADAVAELARKNPLPDDVLGEQQKAMRIVLDKWTRGKKKEDQ